MSGRTRANGEGSIFPYRNGYAAYVWVTTPAGKRTRKYVYGKTREIVHDKWLTLHRQAKDGAVSTSAPTVAAYLQYWLSEVAKPNLAPHTVANYEMFVRHYITPTLGTRRLDRLSVREIQSWLNKLHTTCQCCAQGKDASRPPDEQRCCAKQNCCNQVPSSRTCRDAWSTLRAALSSAVREELIGRNPAMLVRPPKASRSIAKPWSVEEARRFLESARSSGDPLYSAYVLILVLGLRRGELLGLRCEDVDLDAATLSVSWQLQRIDGRLYHRETKTAASDAVLPLPRICVTALQEWLAWRTRYEEAAKDAWQGSDLLFTTRMGSPIEPRNFHRSFKARCLKAAVRPVPVHTTRRTCASLLVALDVHPRVAMQILRHSQIAVTMNVYSQVSSKETELALRRLGEQLDG